MLLYAEPINDHAQRQVYLNLFEAALTFDPVGLTSPFFQQALHYMSSLSTGHIRLLLRPHRLHGILVAWRLAKSIDASSSRREKIGFFGIEFALR